MHKSKLPFTALIELNSMSFEKLLSLTIDGRISERKFLKYNTHIHASVLCPLECLSKRWYRKSIDSYPYSFLCCIYFFHEPVFAHRSDTEPCIGDILLFSTDRYFSVVVFIRSEVETAEEDKKCTQNDTYCDV